LFTERFSDERLAQILLPHDRCHPFPTADEREPWEAIPDEVRAEMIARGEALLGFTWPLAPATTFMEFRRNGNRNRQEGPYFARRRVLTHLVMAECADGHGRFLDDIINGIWSICEESFWGVSAHNHSRRFPGSPLPDPSERIIDLFVGETCGLMSWTHYLLHTRLDSVAPVVCDRLRREVQERVVEPYLTRDDFGWMGLPDKDGKRAWVNNWNPWCNSNCLLGALLIEDDESRRLQAVSRALNSLEAFIRVYHSDGGCDEGTSYWDRAGGALFDCLEILRWATDGALDLYDDPLIANMGRFLYRSFIAGPNWFINFADGGAKVGISADLVNRYGERIGDEKLKALGSSAYHGRPLGAKLSPSTFSLQRVLPAALHAATIRQGSAEPPRERDAWMDGIQVMAAREQEGTEAGLYVAAKGGHNAESHNHNDVGQFIVFLDGQPVLVDAGVETYTAKTFSRRRYELWTMQSAYHNLPTIGGVQQADGVKFAARDVRYLMDDAGAELSLDIAGAYPEAAGVETWQRSVRLERGQSPRVVVGDCFRLREAKEVTLSLITPLEATVEEGRMVLKGDVTAEVTLPPGTSATVERLNIEDARLGAVWGDHLWRVVVKMGAPVSEGCCALEIKRAPA
jgi:hypothetical protein